MKHAYSFLAGVALVSLCVISTRSLPGYMFGLGFLVCLGCFLILHVKGILRLVPHWSSGTQGGRSSKLNGMVVRQLPIPAPRDRKDSGLELPARRYSRTARNAKCGSVVQSSNVLSSVQQEVLSALCNLKVPFGEAQQAVCSASKEHGGESFDQLFRVALNLVNAGAGKSRRAA